MSPALELSGFAACWVLSADRTAKAEFPVRAAEPQQDLS